jgi:hypothetical protein
VTIPYEITEEGGEEYEQNVTEQLEPVVVPVRVVFNENERLPPEFAGMMTWSVSQAPLYTTVLQRSYKRFKAKLLASFPGAGTLYLNTKIDPLTNPSPQGFSVTVTAAGLVPLPEYEAMQPLYAAGSIAGITLAVMDERYGAVQ